MKPLDSSYGKNTYDVWNKNKPKNLKSTKTTPNEANQNIWTVSSYRELLGAVSFLSVMNKRLTLFYRGQTKNIDPLPTIFRNDWQPLQSGERVPIPSNRRQWYFDQLTERGKSIYEICDSPELGLPRWRGLRDRPVIQWAIIQHYGIWPTPLIDISSNLRVAASFALGHSRGSAPKPKTAYLYVIGLPYSTEWITDFTKEELVLARLQSACPPIAMRPHYQEGFLVGTAVLNGVTQNEQETSRIAQRLVAKFKLCDSGRFWNRDFPIISKNALLPRQDKLLSRLHGIFGPNGSTPIRIIAEELAT